MTLNINLYLCQEHILLNEKRGGKLIHIKRILVKHLKFIGNGSQVNVYT